MTTNRRKTILQNTALTLTSLLFTFAIIETGFRVLDPTPYFTDAEINNTEHGNLSMFDATLGWRGVPNGDETFVTRNNRVQLTHNSQGFRDIEHANGGRNIPAIVFLGDSFTWGYEVEFEQMFVNQLRDKLPAYEIFNLAHRGYGTDQAYLTFKDWPSLQPLQLVVLMFSENDNGDNNAIVNYRKSKPRFELHNNTLTLTGVPVPRNASWSNESTTNITGEQNATREAFKTFFYSSHFFNNMRIRNKLYRNSKKAKGSTTEQAPNPEPGYALTGRILEELQREVIRRGAQLVVVFIPSVREIDALDDAPPYQVEVAALCDKLGISHFDLAPALKDSVLRTYYRQGMHWNARGHEIAAAALEPFLQEVLVPERAMR